MRRIDRSARAKHFRFEFVSIWAIRLTVCLSQLAGAHSRLADAVRYPRGNDLQPFRRNERNISIIRANVWSPMICTKCMPKQKVVKAATAPANSERPNRILAVEETSQTETKTHTFSHFFVRTAIKCFWFSFPVLFIQWSRIWVIVPAKLPPFGFIIYLPIFIISW